MKFLFFIFFCLVLIGAQEPVQEKIVLHYKVDKQNPAREVREKMVAHIANYLAIEHPQKVAWLQHIASLAVYTSNKDGTVTAEISYKVLFENFHVLYKESQALQSKIAEITQKNASSNKELSAEKEKNKNLETDLQKQKQQIAEDKKNLDQQINAYKEQIENLQKQCTQHAEDKKNFNEQINAYKEQIENLQKQCSQNAEAIKHKDFKISLASKQVLGLQEQHNKDTETLNAKNTEIKNLQETIHLLKNQNHPIIKTKELQLIRSKRLIGNLKNQITAWESRYEKQQRALRDFAKKLDYTKEQLKKVQILSKANEQIKSKLDTLRANNKTLRNELDKWSHKNLDDEKDQKEITFLREQNDKILEALFSANKEVKKLTAEKHELDKQNSQCKAELQIHRKETETAKQNLQKLQTQLDVLREKYMALYQKYWKAGQEQDNANLKKALEYQKLLLEEFKKLKADIYFFFDEE